MIRINDFNVKKRSFLMQKLSALHIAADKFRLKKLFEAFTKLKIRIDREGIRAQNSSVNLPSSNTTFTGDGVSIKSMYKNACSSYALLKGREQSFTVTKEKMKSERRMELGDSLISKTDDFYAFFNRIKTKQIFPSGEAKLDSFNHPPQTKNYAQNARVQNSRTQHATHLPIQNCGFRLMNVLLSAAITKQKLKTFWVLKSKANRNSARVKRAGALLLAKTLQMKLFGHFCCLKAVGKEPRADASSGHMQSSLRKPVQSANNPALIRGLISLEGLFSLLQLRLRFDAFQLLIIKVKAAQIFRKARRRPTVKVRLSESFAFPHWKGTNSAQAFASLEALVRDRLRSSFSVFVARVQKQRVVRAGSSALLYPRTASLNQSFAREGLRSQIVTGYKSLNATFNWEPASLCSSPKEDLSVQAESFQAENVFDSRIDKKINDSLLSRHSHSRSSLRSSSLLSPGYRRVREFQCFSRGMAAPPLGGDPPEIVVHSSFESSFASGDDAAEGRFGALQALLTPRRHSFAPFPARRQRGAAA